MTENVTNLTSTFWSQEFFKCSQIIKSYQFESFKHIKEYKVHRQVTYFIHLTPFLSWSPLYYSVPSLTESSLVNEILNDNVTYLAANDGPRMKSSFEIF